MKKWSFLLALSLFWQIGYTQEITIKKVRTAYEKGDWSKAKDAVDGYLANEKGAADWEGWYYKGLIYGQIGKDAALKGSVPNAWETSYQAYRKSLEIDPKQSNTFMLMRNFPVFENYQELFKKGIEQYNNKEYKAAYDTYLLTDQIGRFIYQNKWALSELDTLLTFYIGASALQADMNEEAVVAFQKIADKEIGGEGYEMIYEHLAYHFDQKGDKEKADQYVKSGRKLYPNDSYYDKLDLDRERKIGASPKLFEKYDIVLKKDPNNYDLRYDYAAEMFNWLFTDQQAKESEKEKTFNDIIAQLNKCASLEPTKSEAFLLIGKAYYNQAASFQDKYNNLKPADQQKRTEVKTQIDNHLKEAIKNLTIAAGFFEKMSQDDFKKDRRNKSEYKTTLYLLSEAYKFLGDTKKSQEYEKKEQSVQ